MKIVPIAEVRISEVNQLQHDIREFRTFLTRRIAMLEKEHARFVRMVETKPIMFINSIKEFSEVTGELKQLKWVFERTFGYSGKQFSLDGLVQYAQKQIAKPMVTDMSSGEVGIRYGQRKAFFGIINYLRFGKMD